MIGAFLYLAVHSARNRVITQARRLRNPRYAIALLLGVGYFWFVFFNRSARMSRDVANPFAGEMFGILLPIGMLLFAAYMWLGGADRSALAFSNAEVSMLFTAPVSRRGLIIYKLVRSQATVLTSSLVWVMLFGRGHDALTRALGYWVMFSTLNLHRLGVALVHASGSEHGIRGFRRILLPLAIFGGAAIVVVIGLLNLRQPLMHADSLRDMLPILSTAFASPPLSWVIYPFRVALAPAVTPAGAAWARAMLPALGLLALHFVWVLRSDAAFEEVAAQASAARAKRLDDMRARRLTGAVSVKSARRTIALRPIGAPAMALVWKNTLWLVRTGQLRPLVGLPVVLMIAAFALSTRTPQLALTIAGLCGIFCLVMLFFGPMTMRNDLRGELRRLSMIKTLPLTGQQIIFAEVASSASPSAAVQYLLVIVGLVSMLLSHESPWSLPVRLAIVVAAPLLLIGLNLANFTIHNAFALLFPGWVRLGESSPGGIEVMGQAMLTSIVTLLMLALLLIGPGLGVTAVYFVLRHQVAAMVLVAGTIAGAALCLEAYLLAEMLGGTLERTEPLHVG